MARDRLQRDRKPRRNLRHQQIVAIRQQSVTVLGNQLAETQARFEVGLLTRTDVARGEAQAGLCGGACPLLETRNPFDGARPLPPAINALVPLADDPVLSGTVTRSQQSRTGTMTPVPAAVSTVSLRDREGRPTGLSAPVAADGSWTIRLPTGASPTAYVATLTGLDGTEHTPLDAYVTLPLVGPSVAAGGVLCYARALGEFGATITFAGNFPGTTQTMPLAIYLAMERDPDVALALSLVLIAVSLAVLVGLRSRWLSGLLGVGVTA